MFYFCLVLLISWLTKHTYGQLSCQGLDLSSLQDVDVLSAAYVKLENFTVPATPPLSTLATTNINVCQVEVSITHFHAGDHVNITVWLPLEGWNGRFVAAGGSAWAAGLGPIAIAPFATQGFAAASTDAGLPFNPLTPSEWALKPSGELNYELLMNFASRSVHDVAIVGKAVTSAFYGKPAEFSYWNGCSTGGRQGLVAAQEYPADFDGILAGAPAIYWPEYVIAELWPQVVMQAAGYFPSACEFDFFTKSAIDACDEIDGAEDGIVTIPQKCRFDAYSLVGQEAACSGGKPIAITKTTASIVHQIWSGPQTTSGRRLWFGSPQSANLSALAGSTDINGTIGGAPFLVPDSWIKYFVEQNPSYDWTQITPSTFEALFRKSASKSDQTRSLVHFATAAAN